MPIKTMGGWEANALFLVYFFYLLCFALLLTLCLECSPPSPSVGAEAEAEEAEASIEDSISSSSNSSNSIGGQSGKKRKAESELVSSVLHSPVKLVLEATEEEVVEEVISIDKKKLFKNSQSKCVRVRWRPQRVKVATMYESDKKSGKLSICSALRKYISENSDKLTGTMKNLVASIDGCQIVDKPPRVEEVFSVSRGNAVVRYHDTDELLGLLFCYDGETWKMDDRLLDFFATEAGTKEIHKKVKELLEAHVVEERLHM